jgi:hypothetical protein
LALLLQQRFRAEKAVTKAFSSEVDTGSRQENALNHESGAPFRLNRNGKGSSVTLTAELSNNAAMETH